MGDLTPVVLSLLAGIVGIVGTILSARKFNKLGLGKDQRIVNTTLRELADVWEEKFHMKDAELADAKAAHVATAAELTSEKYLGKQCREDLDDVRSELRALERQRGRPRA